MCRFIETIQIINGKLLNSGYHQKRVERTFANFFPGNAVFDIPSFLRKHSLPGRGRYRCTLSYSNDPEEISITEYKPRKIKSLKLVTVNNIEYSWKYANRTELNRLLETCLLNEEIIIIKNGFITDTSYTNLVFHDGEKWLTPSSPLLKGTRRQKLLEEGKILESEIRLQDLGKFTKCSLINAMMDIGELEVNIQNIVS